MARPLRHARTLAPLVLLAGCVSTPATKAPAPAQPGAAAVAPAGLEAVIGATARALVARYGNPDLDMREGGARKLQFGSPACVLDVYLYPRSDRAEPVVTYVDARLPDGRDMDRASCVAALNAQAQSR